VASFLVKGTGSSADGLVPKPAMLLDVCSRWAPPLAGLILVCLLSVFLWIAYGLFAVGNWLMLGVFVFVCAGLLFLFLRYF
jgi:hypothetical protein